MHQVKTMKRMSAVVNSVLLTVLIVAAGCSVAPSDTVSGALQQPAPSGANSAPEALSAGGQAQLTSLLDKTRLSELQWPNFSDYAAQVREFYDKDGHLLAWSRGGKPTQQALDTIQLLQQAGLKGLDSRDYDGERWAGRLKALAGEMSLVNFDVSLTVSAMRYASDLHLGKLDPRTLHTDFEPERNEYDLCDFLLKKVVPASNVGDAFARIEPPYQGYHRVLEGLQRYEQLEADEKPANLPAVTKPIAPGQPYAAVPQLLERLKFVGDAPPTASLPADPHIYQGSVVDAVKRFQLRHGLEAQGKLGAQTIAALNVPMSRRVEQLKLALERWRWVPHNFDQPPIVVNIPEFLLRGYDENRKVVVSMPVVVGPYWNVPPSILRNEIVPKIAKDRSYVQKSGFEVTTYSGEVVTDGVISDEVLAQLRGGKLTVRQKPGPKNALGLIKFIFPNNNNVYLHSTPSQAAFSESRRDFSHGCVRVEDPAALAAYVLRNNPGWTRDRVDAAFKAEKQEQVNLTKPIPVLIVYGTAISPEQGQVRFFDDIYGHDASLEKLFNQAYDSRK